MSASAAPRQLVDPADCPSLSAKQLGHLRHIVDLAHQPSGDWSFMGDSRPGFRNDAYQFQLAFMAYALGVAHYHATPAYRELYQDASAALIAKMTEQEVWDYWASMSRKRGASGGTDSDGAGWIDPVAKANIMYSGHLLQMVSLHEALFDDRRYDEPGSLAFVFASPSYGEPPIRILYDHDRLAEVIYRQFVDDDYRGIECARGSVYSDCNQHPILGLIQYDQTHRTDYAADVQRGFQHTIEIRGYVSPATHTTMHRLDVATDTVIPATSAWLDGWNGHAYHVWQKEAVESFYPHQVKRYLPKMFHGEPGEDMGSNVSYDFGWFALLAAELGDTETLEEMLDYADAHFDPQWRNHAYYYPFTPEYKTDHRRDENGYIGNVSPITGNALLAYARLAPKDGIWTLYNRPWGKEHFDAPYISGVDRDLASVSQAIYDFENEALIVTLVPGPADAGETSFTVNQPARTRLIG